MAQRVFRTGGSLCFNFFSPFFSKRVNRRKNEEIMRSRTNAARLFYLAMMKRSPKVRVSEFEGLRFVVTHSLLEFRAAKFVLNASAFRFGAYEILRKFRRKFSTPGLSPKKR